MVRFFILVPNLTQFWGVICHVNTKHLHVLMVQGPLTYPGYRMYFEIKRKRIEIYKELLQIWFSKWIPTFSNWISTFSNWIQMISNGTQSFSNWFASISNRITTFFSIWTPAFSKWRINGVVGGDIIPWRGRRRLSSSLYISCPSYFVRLIFSSVLVFIGTSRCKDDRQLLAN